MKIKTKLKGGTIADYDDPIDQPPPPPGRGCG